MRYCHRRASRRRHCVCTLGNPLRSHHTKAGDSATPLHAPPRSAHKRDDMTVFVFGNAVLKQDSLPLCILSELQKKFPQIEFRALDPNEEWNAPEEMIIIDTVMGIKDITVFDS